MDREIFYSQLCDSSLVRFTDEERERIIRDSLERVNSTVKHFVVMEELAELSQAVSKVELYPEDWRRRVDLIEEMADVVICLKFLQRLHDIPDRTLDNAVDIKLLREKGRNCSYKTVQDVFTELEQDGVSIETRTYNAIIYWGKYGDWPINNFISLLESNPDEIRQVRNLGTKSFKDLCRVVDCWREKHHVN